MHLWIAARVQKQATSYHASLTGPVMSRTVVFLSYISQLPSHSGCPISSCSDTSISPPLFYSSSLRASSPPSLAPIGRTAEILARTAEVGSRAAKPSRTLGIDDRPAGIARICNLRGCGRSRGHGLSIALAVTGLAAGTAVDGLILELLGGD